MFFNELKHALRLWRRDPGFTLIAIAALMLGIGVNVAVFSVANAVILTPVPAPDPDRIMVFGTTRPGGRPLGASITRYNIWHEMADIFDDVSAYRYGTMDLTDVDHPRQVQMAQVSESYFRLFGLQAAQGRTFSREEDLPNSGKFVVISHPFWLRALDGDPAIVGKTISLSGTPHVVVGVMAPGTVTESPLPIEVWTPFQIPANSSDQNHFFGVAGRLKAGVTKGTVAARLRAATAEFRKKWPNVSTMLPGYTFEVEPIRDTVGREIRTPLLILSAAVALVLLIACGNVANLLLMRAAGREREIVIRVATGASRIQIMRQLLIESLLLAGAGGVLGVALGSAGIRALVALSPVQIPRAATALGVDWRVAAFAAGVSLVTGVLFGLIPALEASRPRFSFALRGSSFRHRWLRGTLVAGELALAVTLLVGCGLLIRSFVVARSVDLGFSLTNVVVMQLSLTGEQYQKSAAVTRLAHSTIEAIESIPGVENVSTGCCIPVGSIPNGPYYVPGRPVNGTFHGRANIPTVMPNYFKVLRIPIVEGRGFNESDRAGSPLVFIINQTLARKYWPNGGAIGSRLRGSTSETDPGAEIVGVAADTGDRTSLEDGDLIYRPLAQVSDQFTAYLNRMPARWMIRTRGPATPALTRAIEQKLEQLSGLPVTGIHSMGEMLDQTTAPQDFNLILMSIFAASALVLAALGVYGVMSYSVEQRKLEIGIRLALGDDPAHIGTLIVREGLALAGIGTIAGLGASYALAKTMASLLFGVDPHDSWTFLAVPVVLVVVAGVAMVPAVLRASRVDPIAMLRADG